MWNMRTEFAAVLIGVLVAGAGPGFVAAQQQPQPFPSENNANKFLNRGIPKVENPIDKRTDRGLRSLGLPTQPQFDTTKNAEQLPERPPVLERNVPRHQVAVPPTVRFSIISVG